MNLSIAISVAILINCTLAIPKQKTNGDGVKPENPQKTPVKIPETEAKNVKNIEEKSIPPKIYVKNSPGIGSNFPSMEEPIYSESSERTSDIFFGQYRSLITDSIELLKQDMYRMIYVPESTAIEWTCIVDVVQKFVACIKPAYPLGKEYQKVYTAEELLEQSSNLFGCALEAVMGISRCIMLEHMDSEPDFSDNYHNASEQ